MTTRRSFIQKIAGAASLIATGGAYLSDSAGATSAGGIMPDGGVLGVAEPKNLFILGWDGAGLNNVLPMLRAGRLPNLKRFLSSRGKLCPLQLIGHTMTVTSWAQVFTGLTHDQTSMIGNAKHDLETGLVAGLHPVPYHPQFIKSAKIFNHAVWYQEIPFERSILKPIQALGNKVGFFVSKGFLSNVDNQPFRSIGASIDRAQMFNPNMDLALPIREGRINDTYLTWLKSRAFKYMNENEKYMIFLHLDPDIYGHKYGEASSRYLNEFVRCDRVLGELLDRVNPDTTNIMVITDHGFDPNSFNHSNAPDAWLATDMPVDPVFVRQTKQKAFGTMRDVAHTILDHYKIPLASMPLQMRGVSMLA